MSLEDILRDYAHQFGIDDSFIEASDHPYTCGCSKCKNWWVDMGPDPDTGRCGPFTLEEINVVRRVRGLPAYILEEEPDETYS